MRTPLDPTSNLLKSILSTGRIVVQKFEQNRRKRAGACMITVISTVNPTVMSPLIILAVLLAVELDTREPTDVFRHSSSQYAVRLVSNHHHLSTMNCQQSSGKEWFSTAVSLMVQCLLQATTMLRNVGRKNKLQSTKNVHFEQTRSAHNH